MIRRIRSNKEKESHYSNFFHCMLNKNHRGNQRLGAIFVSFLCKLVGTVGFCHQVIHKVLRCYFFCHWNLRLKHAFVPWLPWLCYHSKQILKESGLHLWSAHHNNFCEISWRNWDLISFHKERVTTGLEVAAVLCQNLIR